MPHIWPCGEHHANYGRLLVCDWLNRIKYEMMGEYRFLTVRMGVNPRSRSHSCPRKPAPRPVIAPATWRNGPVRTGVVTNGPIKSAGRVLAKCKETAGVVAAAKPTQHPKTPKQSWCDPAVPRRATTVAVMVIIKYLSPYLESHG